VYAGLEYGHQLTDALSGSIGFDFNYISDYPGLVEVTTPGESITSVGDYSTVNGHYVLTLNESTDFELFAKNVFDERGVTAETSPTNLFGFQRYLIRPRTIGVQVRHRF
jgi:hypothetical protein